jgi:hypothetical protein
LKITIICKQIVTAFTPATRAKLHSKVVPTRNYKLGPHMIWILDPKYLNNTTLKKAKQSNFLFKDYIDKSDDIDDDNIDRKNC